MAEEMVNGIKVLVLDCIGSALSSEADALDLIGQTSGTNIETIALPDRAALLLTLKA